MEKTSEKTDSNVVGKILAGVILGLFTVAALLFCGFSFYTYLHADEFGIEVGTAAGSAAGKLQGSFDGITQGLAEGAEEGKEAGLSAADTTVDIGNKMQAIGKLEVLSATVVMHDKLSISDKYSTLLAFYGDITFTVDLYNTEISIDGNKYEVILPLPENQLRIDDHKSEQLASSMKYSWMGSNEDGYTAATNSINELVSNAEESVSNYELLNQRAKESAVKQVTFLIQSATPEEVIVHVSFKDKGTQTDSEE